MYPKTFKKTCQKGMPRSQSGKICQEGIPKKKKKKHVLKEGKESGWQGRSSQEDKTRASNYYYQTQSSRNHAVDQHILLFVVVLFLSLIETLHDHILAKLITLLDQKNLLTPHGSPDFGSRKIITILIFLYPLQDQTVTRDY